ncbi:MAG: DNA repair protein RecO [Candidatus Omnitrophica bacterium]|nr:DNA repair protein RecO [Candidatus Omnitrophota bacterium]
MTKTEAVILRRQEIRETSLGVVAFSRELGKVNGLVKGVRGGRAAVPWFLEPLTLQWMVIYQRRRSPWSLVSSFELVDAFDPIRRDLTRTAYAGLCLDLVDGMTEVADPHPEIFELLLRSLRGLSEGADCRLIARFLEAHLLKLSGVLPGPESMRLSNGAKLSLREILEGEGPSLGRLALVRSVEEELREKFKGLFHGVLGRELKARNFLYSIGFER